MYQHTLLYRYTYMFPAAVKQHDETSKHTELICWRAPADAQLAPQPEQETTPGVLRGTADKQEMQQQAAAMQLDAKADGHQLSVAALRHEAAADTTPHTGQSAAAAFAAVVRNQTAAAMQLHNSAVKRAVASGPIANQYTAAAVQQQAKAEVPAGAQHAQHVQQQGFT